MALHLAQYVHELTPILWPNEAVALCVCVHVHKYACPKAT